MIIRISGKALTVDHIDGPTGVSVRTSNNNLIRRELHWAPDYPLLAGVERTYRWIESQIALRSA